MTEDWIVLDEVPGMLQAEILRGLLEAQEIPTVLSQEGAGRAIGLTVGTLGTVQVLVPSKDQDRARELLNAYYSGDIETPEE
jgi:Putative prokaryotic signal transducing protein